MKNKYNFLLISGLVLGFALTAFVFTTQANILSIILDPSLNISRFAPYKIKANISDNPESVSVDISSINGNVTNTTTCWNFFVDGRCDSDARTKSMINVSGDLWESTNIFPDDIYPEIFFVPSDITWYYAPEDRTFNRNNYQILKFNNPFEMVDGMSFFIEFNTIPQAINNSADLQVYLVAKNKDISFFNTDWRSSPDVSLVGTINRSQNVHHTHTSNSSHYLVALSTDSTGKVAGLDVSDDFWVILYNNSPNNNRGWSIRYHTICDAEASGYWYQGSQANWSTSLQTGCPDAHIHIARTLTDNNLTVRDGVQAVVTATYNDSSVATSSELIYFTPLINLAPNSTSFISPIIGNVYSAGPIEISWNPATDPNNDPLLYDIHLLDSEGVATSTLATATTTTSFSWDITDLPNGQYSLKGVITEDILTDPLSTDFFLGGNFTIDQAATLYSLSNINLASNNASTTLAKAGDVVTLTFQSSGEIDPVVNIYSGGTQIDSGRVNIASSTNNFTVTYVVQAADDNGSVSFEISASNLNQIYNDTTNSSYVVIDNTISAIVCGEATIIHNGLTYGTIMKDGLCWLDRNLGASQVCTSSTDSDCYGDYYQWGRGLDGHQILGSDGTSILSDYDYPGHGDFIVIGVDPFDWRNPQNSNLWQGVFGINNPCPLGFRLPTGAELTNEMNDWSTQNSVGAFASPLKLPISSLRTALSGLLQTCIGDCPGAFWSSSVDNVYSVALSFDNDFAEVSSSVRANGMNVRCVRDDLVSLTYTAGENGSITGETSQTILEGQDGTTVTAVPNTGYTFTSWSDGVLTASRTDTNVTADITVTAEFNLISSSSPDPTPSSSSSSTPPPPAIGDGQTDVTVPMNSLGSLGEVDSGGVNYLSYVGSQASFSTPISTTNNLSDHWLVINNLDLNSQLINLTIKSEPQTFQLASGESVLVDLDGDNIKDIEVKFTDLLVNRTELTITSVLRDQIISPPILELPVIDSKAITQEARNSFTNQNLDLSQRLAGQILLQVENNGQAWYFDPLSQMRYYLGRPDDAFAIMRKKGIGITNINLAKIPVSLRFLSGLDSDSDGLPDNLEIALNTNLKNQDSDGDGYDDYTELFNGYTPLGIGRLNYDFNFAKAQAGKIFLQVEGRGEAWYVSPENNQRYFLGRPADALSIMKGLSLGISNANLNQLLVGEID